LAVAIRLTRVGARNNPIWRVVAADKRSPRDGRFIEVLGHYNPQTEPSTIELDEDKLRGWIQQGAQPSATVKRLMKAKGISA
jgi:small subunit ribosomal protein S16